MIFITDRKEEDVALGHRNGRYTYMDLNRVEQNVQTLCELAANLGIVVEVSVKTDWRPPGNFDAAEWPTQTQMGRYLQNVRNLCAALDLQVNLPVSMRHLTVAGANSIEIALKQAYEEIQRRME